MSILFRVDASNIIGTGHVMRCLTLANHLRENNVESHFVCREHLGHLQKEIKCQGHKVTLLPLDPSYPSNRIVNKPSDYQTWLGASPQDDVKATLACISPEDKIDWLVVDHFAIDSVWEGIFEQTRNVHIMVIDGQAKRKHKCELLFDPTYSDNGSDRWGELVPKDCQLLLGPQYSLLRSEFERVERWKFRKHQYTKRIFISFGGADSPNATKIIVDAILELNLKHIKLDVLLGVANPHVDELLIKYKNDKSVQIYIGVDNVAELMSEVDLAISAGGTTIWELCTLGIPTFIVSIAENQIDLAQKLDSLSCIKYLGELDKISINQCIQENLIALLDSEASLQKMSLNSMRLMARKEVTICDYLLKVL